MRRRMFRAILAIAAALVLSAFPLQGQSKTDPLLGTWTLDLTKSTFAGARPAGRTITVAATPNGLKIGIATTNSGIANNATVAYRLDFEAKFDGKDHPAPTSSAFSAITIERVDANTVRRVGKLNGQPIHTETYTVSADGKTLTVRQEGTANGQPFDVTQVYGR